MKSATSRGGRLGGSSHPRPKSRDLGRVRGAGCRRVSATGLSAAVEVAIPPYLQGSARWHEQAPAIPRVPHADPVRHARATPSQARRGRSRPGPPVRRARAEGCERKGHSAQGERCGARRAPLREAGVPGSVQCFDGFNPRHSPRACREPCVPNPSSPHRAHRSGPGPSVGGGGCPHARGTDDATAPRRRIS